MRERTHLAESRTVARIEAFGLEVPLAEAAWGVPHIQAAHCNKVLHTVLLTTEETGEWEGAFTERKVWGTYGLKFVGSLHRSRHWK